MQTKPTIFSISFPPLPVSTIRFVHLFEMSANTCCFYGFVTARTPIKIKSSKKIIVVFKPIKHFVRTRYGGHE